MFAAIGHTWRLLRVGFTLIRYDALMPKEYEERMPLGVRGIARALRLFARQRRAKSVGVRLATALEKLGPAYVKVGQFLATRPDIIGVTAANDLGRLKDRLPPFPRDEALDTIAAELGATETLFGQISDAMAAASIAQVHQAIVPREGVKAIKILRPRIEKKMRKEMGALGQARDDADLDRRRAADRYGRARTQGRGSPGPGHRRHARLSRRRARSRLLPRRYARGKPHLWR
jgi:ubiquinone biosynthesis protein